MRWSLLLLAVLHSCRCGPDGADLAAEPRTVDFGEVQAGTSALREFQVQSSEALTVSVTIDPDFGSPAGFAPAVAGSIVLEPGRSTSVAWRFAPAAGTSGARSARLVLNGGRANAEVFLVARIVGGVGGGVSGGLSGGGLAAGGTGGGLAGGLAGGGLAGGFAGGGFAGGGLGGGGFAGGGLGGGGLGGGGLGGGGLGGGGLAGGGLAGGFAGGGLVGGGLVGGGFAGGGLAGGGLAGGGLAGGGLAGGGLAGGFAGGGFAGGGLAGGGLAGGGLAGGGLAGGGQGGGAGTCAQACTSWTQCTAPGTGCDTNRGCCVPCGGLNQPCCVNFAQGRFSCGTGMVCGRSLGFGSTVGYFCCANAGDGCCQQGGCSGNTCCKCPNNGLNFCVQPSFGCGGC